MQLQPSAKKLLVALLLLGSIINAQTVNKQWADQVNQAFSGIDKNNVPHSLLKDYAMELIDLNGYNGVLTPENYVHKGTFTSIYNTLLMARVKTNVPGLVAPTIFKANWDRERKRNVIALSGLYYKYSRFKENAYSNGLVTISNNVLYDRYINGAWQNPYEEKEVFAVSSPILKYKGLEVDVTLPQTLWYTNQADAISKIAIDFGDGNGYVDMPFGDTRHVSYTQEGMYKWKYLLELRNGEKLFSHTIIYIEQPLYGTTVNQLRPPTEPCTNGLGIDRVEFTGTQSYAGQANTAILEINYANNDCVIRRPLIVAEGFDSGLMGVENGLGDSDYYVFFNEAFFGTNILSGVITDYDIIYINWDNGKDYLQRNALLLEDIISWVNSEKEGNTPNVVLGQSMGGVIARYALADMEQRGLNHDTGLYISHDAPHQGANLPVSILYFARHIADQFVSTPVGDVNINPSDGAPVSIEDIETLINAPGTRQLLLYNVDENFTVNNDLHNAWQAELQAKGYPELTRNIAISNASHCAFPQDFNPHDLLFSLNGEGRTTILTDMLLEALRPLSNLGFIALAITFDEPGFLVGILPGNSKFGIDFWARALPYTGQNQQIYKGKLTYTKKLFWLVNITVNLTDKGFNNPPGSLPYDYYPGGQYRVPFNFQDIVVENWFFEFGINSYVAPVFNFIPSVSALDVGSGNASLTNEDYLMRYNAVAPPTGNKAIPFHNFITGYENNNSLNEAHISFNDRNGTWLALELDQTNGNEDVFNCTFGCSNREIGGLSRICDGTAFSYSVPEGADSYLWNVIGGDIVTVTSPSTDTNSLSLTRNGAKSGWISVSVRISSVKCGVDDLVLIKDVYVGAPTVESIEFINTSDGDGNTSGGPELPPNPTVISDGCEVYLDLQFTPGINEITAIEWEKITTDVSWSRDITNHGGRYVYLYPTCNKEFRFRVRAKSNCGEWSHWQELSHDITACTSNCSSSSNSIVSDNFVLYPVPSNTVLNIGIASNYTWNFPPSTDSIIDDDDPYTDPDSGGSSSNNNEPYAHPSLSLSLSFFNNVGVLVYSTTTSGVPHEMDISNLPPGTYMLVIGYEGQTESHAITIN